MKNMKNEKIITLVVVILLFVVVAVSIYVLSNRNTEKEANMGLDNMQQDTESELATEAGEEQENFTGDFLLLLEGGTFTVGSPQDERQRGQDEVSHEVTIGAFYVDPYEVRQSDYERIMGENPSHFRGGDLPVENVTWYEAVEYCNRLSESAGLTPVYTIEGDTVSWNRSADGYRLLTEAEWEYAARAGTTTIYNFGNQVHSDYENFEGMQKKILFWNIES